MGRRLTGCRAPVVACGAWAGDATVIEAHRRPAAGDVTIVAYIARGQVCRRFAERRGAIVAILAGTDDFQVIDTGHRAPAGAGVAGLTGIGGLDVSGRLAGGGAAVVARGTAAGDGAVVEHGAAPGAGRMAVVAGIARGDVGG